MSTNVGRYAVTGALRGRSDVTEETRKKLRNASVHWEPCTLERFRIEAPHMPERDLLLEYAIPTETVLALDPKPRHVIYGAGPAGLSLAHLLERMGQPYCIMDKRRDFMTRDYIVWVSEDSKKRFRNMPLKPVAMLPKDAPPMTIIEGDERYRNEHKGGIIKLNDLQNHFYKRLSKDRVFPGIVLKRDSFDATFYNATGTLGESDVTEAISYGMVLILNESPWSPERLSNHLVPREETRYFYDNGTFYLGAKISKATYNNSKRNKHNPRMLALNLIDQKAVDAHPNLKCTVHRVRVGHARQSSEIVLGNAKQSVDFFSGQGVNMALQQAYELAGSKRRMRFGK